MFLRFIHAMERINRLSFLWLSNTLLDSYTTMHLSDYLLSGIWVLPVFEIFGNLYRFLFVCFSVTIYLYPWCGSY